MSKEVWENLISLNAFSDYEFDTLDAAKEYRESDTAETNWNDECDNLEPALELDTYVLPTTSDREGYFGQNHFSYWASGLRDRNNLLACAERLGVEARSYLDFGCATGRVIRHFATAERQIKTYGCDINRTHVDWCAKYLPENITVFQNHSIPTLSLPDNSIDIVSAYSVFTHIEAFETSWLMEIRRILKPGGIAWITVHSEKTFEEVREGWPLHIGLRNHPEFQKYKENQVMDKDRLVFRWKSDASYSSNVFYTNDYLQRTWGRILEIKETHRRLPGWQDVVVLQKD
jgi:SAM-dependent methyltransferase